MVMNAAFLAQYTPLETLLFFQSLRAYSLNAINFGKISGELSTLPLVRNDATYDSERLSADALKNLYLNLVKEEARSDFEKALQDNNGQQNGDLSPPSRKRKAPSPPLPTVEEAAKNSHLLPRLLYRLYTRFRDSVVAQIKIEERQYHHLTHEINQIEQGSWDERFRQEAHRQNAVAPPQGLGVSLPGETHQPVPFVDIAQRPLPIQEKPSAPVSDQVEHRASDARPRSARASIDALVNHTPIPEDHKPSLRKGSSNITPLPPLSEIAPEQPSLYASPNLARPPPHHVASPHMQSPAQRPAQYHPSPPVGHQSPYAQPYHHPVLAQGATPSPKMPNAMAGQSPGSPHRVLPLPPGMKAVQSPVMPNGLPAHQRPPPQLQQNPYASPSQRPPLPVAPNDRQSQRGYAQHQPTHVPSPQGYHPQQLPYQAYQGSPQTPQYSPHPQQQQQQQHPAHYPLRASQQGGFQLPPFQVSAQEPVKSQAQQQQQQPVAPQGTPQSARHPVPVPPNARPVSQPPYGQYSPFPQTPQARPPPTPLADGLTQSVVASLKQSRPSVSRRRSTWKAQNSTGGSPIVRPPRSPSVEPLSPVRKPVIIAPKESIPEPAEAAEPAEPVPAEEPEEVIKFEKPRKQTRRTRGNSIASSIVPSSTRGRTRSQSIMSQANEIPTSADKATRSRKVKDEPSTPAETPRDEEVEDEATPGLGRSTRARRGNAVAAPAQQTSRRRRQTSTPAEEPEESTEEDFPPYIAPRNDVVHATRNFARLSSVILNEITAHRYAGSFQKPVKDVEGYEDIIRRPQDLKSIKAAITAGTRAIAAASAKDSSTDSPAGTPAKDSSTLILEKTADLVPPKAIVNSAQLECEVMRMFANAVLFNPGNEGLVSDARDMSEDIADKIRDWRAVERQGGEESRDDEDETMVESAKGTKRRKM